MRGERGKQRELYDSKSEARLSVAEFYVVRVIVTPTLGSDNRNKSLIPAHTYSLTLSVSLSHIHSRFCAARAAKLFLCFPREGVLER